MVVEKLVDFEPEVLEYLKGKLGVFLGRLGVSVIATNSRSKEAAFKIETQKDWSIHTHVCRI